MAQPRAGGTWRKAVVPFGTAILASVVLGFLISQARLPIHRPPFAPVFVFAAFLVWASNFTVALPQEVSISPDLMVVMVAVAAFRGRGGVLAAALVGLSGGLVWRVFTNPMRSRRGNLLITSFNCGQVLLAASAAALAYGLLDNHSIGRSLLAAAGAASAYAVVNVTLVLASFAGEGEPVRAVWDEMRPALPNFFAFGIIGVLAGQLYSVLGMLSLVLLIVPSIIARRTYQSTIELRSAQAQTISVFLRALYAKDRYTAKHTERVAKYACYIGEELGWRVPRLTHLQQAALMHDIGKLAVSSELLNKPGRLTPEEYNQIRRHNEVCVGILSQVAFLRSTIPVASDKHGFFDTSAEPSDNTALEGYIVAVADAFDAMTSTRAYRKALTMDVAFAELRKGRGKQFHPECVDALIAGIERRAENYGAGYESDVVEFAVEPPAAGVGSAGLGNLETPPLPRRSTNVRTGRMSPFGLS